METKTKLFEYGNSFVVTHDNTDNNPRFLINAICTVTDRGKVDKYYLVEKCKGENTYSKTELFIKTSFDLFCLFGENETLAFRKFKYYVPVEVGEYKRTYKKGEIWGERDFLIKETEGELLDTPGKVNKAVKDGKRLMGRLRIKKGIDIVIDFPIRTINIFGNQWQVDTGYIPFPNFYQYPVYKIASFGMGFIAFNSFNVAEVITEDIVPLVEGVPTLFIINYNDIFKITNPEICLYAV